MAAVSRPGAMAAAASSPATATATAPPKKDPAKTSAVKTVADASAHTMAAWNRPWACSKFAAVLPTKFTAAASAITCNIATAGSHLAPKNTLMAGRAKTAANRSNQVLQLLTLNLASVLFPVLSKLAAEPERQVGAFLRAARVLALVGIPICLAEAVLARPCQVATNKPSQCPATCRHRA